MASGSVNPLRYRHLVDLASTWFREHPLYDERGQPIVVPTWSFPGRGRVQGQLRRTLKVVTTAERTLNALPLRGRQAEMAADLEDTREQAERAMGYVELYGAYAECEAIYGVDRLLERWDRLAAGRPGAVPLRPPGHRLDHATCGRSTCPRWSTTPGSAPPRAGAPARTARDRLRRQVLSPERHFAAFDLENTLVASNVVASYAWLASRRLDRRRPGPLRAADAAPRRPACWRLDRRDRSDFLRYFYRRYEGAPVGQLQDDAYEHASAYILRQGLPRRAAPGARAPPRRPPHRADHRRARLRHRAAAPAVRRRDRGRAVPPGRRHATAASWSPPRRPARVRAQALFDYAAAHGFDPAEGVAYADSTSDLPLLEAVGFPVAVNPETRLAALARKRGWLVEHFDPAPGAPRPVLPLRLRRQRPPARCSGAPCTARR